MKELKLNQFEELNFDEMQLVNGGCNEFWEGVWYAICYYFRWYKKFGWL